MKFNNTFTKTALGAFVMAALLAGSMAEPASAAPRHNDRRGDGWHDNDRYGRNHARSYWRGGRQFYYGTNRPVIVQRYYEPVYAPPPVIYQPEPSGLNFVFPLHIR